MGFRLDELEWFLERVSEKNILIQHMIGQFPVEEVTEGRWREYFHETLERCMLTTLAAYGILVLLYIFIASAFSGGITTICRIFKMNVVIGIPFLFILHHVSTTPWGVDILTGKIHESPFAKLDSGTSITHELMREGITTNPFAEDMLLRSRYDVEHVAGYFSALNYQPGNIHLSRMIADMSGNYLHSPVLNVVADQIITEFENEGRRILRQNGNGDWSIISSAQKSKFVQTMLLTESNPRLMFVKKQLAHLLSVCKLGHNRNTAMFRKHAQVMLLSLEQSVFTRQDQLVSTMALKNFNSYQQHLFTPLKRPTAHRSLTANLDQKPLFSTGDRVEMYFESSWYAGRITELRGTGSTVEFNDGSVETLLTRLLRPFVGYQTGEFVVIDDDTVGNISTVKANGVVTLDFGDGRPEDNVSIDEIRRVL